MEQGGLYGKSWARADANLHALEAADVGAECAGANGQAAFTMCVEFFRRQDPHLRVDQHFWMVGGQRGVSVWGGTRGRARRTGERLRLHVELAQVAQRALALNGILCNLKDNDARAVSNLRRRQPKAVVRSQRGDQLLNQRRRLGAANLRGIQLARPRSQERVPDLG